MIIKGLIFICLLPGLLITNQKLVWNEVVSTIGTRDFTYDNQRQLSSAAWVGDQENRLIEVDNSSGKTVCVYDGLE